MATLNAFKQLGKSIVSDITDAKNAVKQRLEFAAAERKIMDDFKSALREHPVELHAAIEAVTAPKPKRQRKVAQ
jgi:hypothetical protein